MQKWKIKLLLLTHLLDHLRCHPIWSAPQRLDAASCKVGELSRSSKIGKLARSIAVYQDVSALYVAMNDSVAMEVVKTEQDLLDVDADELFIELAKSVGEGCRGGI